MREIPMNKSEVFEVHDGLYVFFFLDSVLLKNILENSFNGITHSFSHKGF